MVVAGCFLLMQRFFRTRWQQVKAFPYYSLLIAVLMIVVLLASTILQRHLLNTYYIDGRKALLYVPVLLLLFAGITSWIVQYYSVAGKVIWFFAYTTGLIHVISIFNFYTCNEWWYDASSKMAYQYIITDKSTASKTTAVNWLFSQSMDFYNNRMYNNRIPLLKKTNELSGYDGINYVYVIGDEIRTVPPVFKPVKRYMWDRFLLTRDEAAYRSAVETFIRRQQWSDSTLQFSAELWQQKADSALLEQRKQLNWNNLLYTE